MKNRRIKTFEARIADNDGIPNASGKMNDIRNQARQEVGGFQRQGKVVSYHQMMAIIDDVMRIERQQQEAIEALAIEIVKSEYGSLMQDVDLDIKLSKLGEVTKDMKDGDDDYEVSPKPERKPITPEIKSEVDKRKIANLITQGESKNAINLFHLFKDAIDEIDVSLFDMYDKIFKTNEAMEWAMPEQGMGDMMYNNQRNIGGMVSVDWEEEEEGDEKKEERQRTAEEIIADIENGGDLHDNEEEISELLSTGNPKIKVRATCLPLLVHETIKGLYELIAAVGIPENEEMAEIVIGQTDTFEDEVEDLKYGRYIKNDFVAFVLESPNANNIPNMKEFVFGEMMLLPAPEFIRLFKGIMERTPDARRRVDAIIADIIEQHNEYNDSKSDDVYGYEDREEYTPTPVRKEEPIAPEPVSTRPENIDYSKMNKRELQRLLDDALDNGDFNTVRKISPFLEGRNYKLANAKLLENRRNMLNTKRRK